MPKPFDLEKALAGAKVVTRDGRAVTELHLFQSSGAYPLWGLIENDVYGFTKDGESCKGGVRLDLFMVDETQERYVNVYAHPNGSIVFATGYLSLEDAEKSAAAVRSYGDYAGTVKIVVTDGKLTSVEIPVRTREMPR